jgi:hypothetical protein
MPTPKSINAEPTTNWTEEELRELDKKWEEGGIVYHDPDYIPGTHPMEIDGAVTWHHVWQKPAPAPQKKD